MTLKGKIMTITFLLALGLHSQGSFADDNATILSSYKQRYCKDWGTNLEQMCDKAQSFPELIDILKNQKAKLCMTVGNSLNELLNGVPGGCDNFFAVRDAEVKSFFAGANSKNCGPAAAVAVPQGQSVR